MRSFFIDLENVRSYGLEGILLLRPEDKVYVFYSDNANTLTIPTIESLNESSAVVKYIKTNYIGANAMDFQIVTLLGASIEKEQKGSFYIISHDNGFKSAVKFCEGYFTGYDIVTGVFANILLAINSEKKDKSDKKDKSSRTAGTKVSGKSGQKQKNTENIGQEPVTDTQKQTDAPLDTDTGKTGGRSRRRRGKNSYPGQVSESVSDGGNTNDRDNTPDNSIETGEDLTADPEKGIESGVAKGTAETVSDTENKKSRSRNRRRRSRSRDKSDPGIENDQPENEELDEKSVINGSEDGFMIIQANSEPDEEQKENRKSGRNSRRRSRGKQRNQNADAENSNDIGSETDKENPKKKRLASANVKSENVNPVNSKPVSSSKYSGNYKYVHDALSDFLSKTTIDMYAAKIDEGIKSSANRNELHAFFKKSYGQDEAEALYKIIASDFDKMKKEAGK